MSNGFTTVAGVFGLLLMALVFFSAVAYSVDYIAPGSPLGIEGSAERTYPENDNADPGCKAARC